MSEEVTSLTNRRLKTPRTAAVGGIVFGVLLIVSYVLIRVSIPADPTTGGVWLEKQANTVALALSLVPIAGIAFLWFIGVVRDRIGSLEDRFFSSVFFGSGLLYLAMMFVSAALAGSLERSHAARSGRRVIISVCTGSCGPSSKRHSPITCES